MYVIICTSLQLTFVSMWIMQLIIKVCKEDTGYSMVGGRWGGSHARPSVSGQEEARESSLHC
jgi:hypothetical protein